MSKYLDYYKFVNNFTDLSLLTEEDIDLLIKEHKQADRTDLFYVLCHNCKLNDKQFSLVYKTMGADLCYNENLTVPQIEKLINKIKYNNDSISALLEFSPLTLEQCLKLIDMGFQPHSSPNVCYDFINSIFRNKKIDISIKDKIIEIQMKKEIFK